MRDPSGVFKYTEWYYLRALDTRGAWNSLVKNNTCLVALRARSPAQDESALHFDRPAHVQDLNLEMALHSFGNRTVETIRRGFGLDISLSGLVSDRFFRWLIPSFLSCHAKHISVCIELLWFLYRATDV